LKRETPIKRSNVFLISELIKVVAKLGTVGALIAAGAAALLHFPVAVVVSAGVSFACAVI
jgi:hypothetical protein